MLMYGSPAAVAFSLAVSSGATFFSLTFLGSGSDLTSGFLNKFFIFSNIYIFQVI